MFWSTAVLPGQGWRNESSNAVASPAIDEHVDAPSVVCDVYRTAGYGDSWHPAPDEIEITPQLCLGPVEDGAAKVREVPDDQAICIGYAVNIPETNYLPPERWLVRRSREKPHELKLERVGP